MILSRATIQQIRLIIQKHLGCKSSQLHLGLMDRSKRGRHIASYVDVIKANDTQFLWHSDASFSASHQYTNSNHIVVAENGRNSSLEQERQQDLPGNDIFLKRCLIACSAYYPCVVVVSTA